MTVHGVRLDCDLVYVQRVDDLGQGGGHRVGSAAPAPPGGRSVERVDALLAGEHEDPAQADPPGGEDVRVQVVADHGDVVGPEPGATLRRSANPWRSTSPRRVTGPPCVGELGPQFAEGLAEDDGRRLAAHDRAPG